MSNFEDPRWRLANLYSTKCEVTGRSIPFVPRPEQMQVVNHLLERPHEPLYIIKSRRLGMSTILGIFMVDQAVFNAGFRGNLVDMTQATASAKMQNIIRHAFLSLPQQIRDTLEVTKSNDGELTFHVKGASETTASSVYAGLAARGGTSNMLWCSELGPIAAGDPPRAREIRTGAFPAARRGIRVVETTWAGGKAGELWELIEPILSKNEAAQGRILFLPWHGDAACTSATGGIPQEIEAYFRDLSERLGMMFTDDQKRWYAATSLELGLFMKREYPSTLDEAFSAPVEGSIYGELLARARAEGRVMSFPVDSNYPVWTFWDLGSPTNTAVAYVVFAAGEIRVIDYDVSFDGTLVERVAHMLSKGYQFAGHVLPHDAAATKTSGRSFVQELQQIGMHNVRVLPRTSDIWIGINRVQQSFPRTVWRVPACEQALQLLELYRTKKSTNGIVPTEDIVHDDSSHVADALRYVAEALAAGFIPEGATLGEITKRKRRPPPVVRTGLRSQQGWDSPRDYFDDWDGPRVTVRV